MSVHKIIPLEEAYRLVDELKRQGRRVVFTNGCFDLLHPGHAQVIAEARKLGDVLIVAINSDASIRGLGKGPGRPVIPQAERAEVIAAFEGVDYVTVFDTVSVQPVVARMQPDVLVKGSTWAPDEIVGREDVEAAGGRVVAVPVVKGYSTTAMVEAARKLHR
jgi:D-beta-D-heptose 7-phosphate kinase/D-beta-D-heptose 1-phosphate adenosyltransferase